MRGVASLADGSSAANRLRMPLSAYVLTARLEQIAEAASLRLERMSGGRYLLAHCDERVGRGRKGGLGLEVLDAWTGRERPPSSLSGGETFQASLALALGLADVVSAEAGGARLETLFVDEGFGTLGDRRARRRARRARQPAGGRPRRSASSPTSPRCASASPCSCTWRRAARGSRIRQA